MLELPLLCAEVGWAGLSFGLHPQILQRKGHVGPRATEELLDLVSSFREKGIKTDLNQHLYSTQSSTKQNP